MLGYGEGEDEEDALRNFLRTNRWVFGTDFKEIICIEITRDITESKRYFIGELDNEL